MGQMPPHGGDEVFQRWRLLLTSSGQQLGPGGGADSWLGLFVGHRGKLVADAAQAVEHSVQRLLTQLHGDS